MSVLSKLVSNNLSLESADLIPQMTFFCIILSSSSAVSLSSKTNSTQQLQEFLQESRRETLLSSEQSIGIWLFQQGQCLWICSRLGHSVDLIKRHLAESFFGKKTPQLQEIK